MNRDFYNTMVQVFPVLLLALVWESGYLERLSAEHRPARREDRHGYFWTKPRVRAWIMLTSGVAVGEVGLTALVLAGVVPDHMAVRLVVLAGLATVLGTILTRAWVDVIHHTASPSPEPAGERQPDHDRDIDDSGVG